MPLQGEIGFFRRHPGRCPGLVCCAPLGLKKSPISEDISGKSDASYRNTHQVGLDLRSSAFICGSRRLFGQALAIPPHGSTNGIWEEMGTDRLTVVCRAGSNDSSATNATTDSMTTSVSMIATARNIATSPIVRTSPKNELLVELASWDGGVRHRL